MFLLAATLQVGWIGGDFVYRKVAAKNIASLLILGYDATTSSNAQTFHLYEKRYQDKNTAMQS